MDWPQFFRELWNILGGAAAALNIVGVLGLLFIKGKYKKILAKHDHDLSVKLAAFQSNLDTARHDHSIAYTRLYEKREAALADLWKHLVRARRLSLDAIATKPKYELQEFRESIELAIEEFEKLEFYFPVDFSKEWYSSLQSMESAVLKVLHARNNTGPNIAEDWQSIRKAVDEFASVWNSKGLLLNRIRSLIRLNEISPDS